MEVARSARGARTVELKWANDGENNLGYTAPRSPLCLSGPLRDARVFAFAAAVRGSSECDP